MNNWNLFWSNINNNILLASAVARLVELSLLRSKSAVRIQSSTNFILTIYCQLDRKDKIKKNRPRTVQYFNINILFFMKRKYFQIDFFLPSIFCRLGLSCDESISSIILGKRLSKSSRVDSKWLDFQDSLNLWITIEYILPGGHPASLRSWPLKIFVTISVLYLSGAPTFSNCTFCRYGIF